RRGRQSRTEKRRRSRSGPHGRSASDEGSGPARTSAIGPGSPAVGVSWTKRVPSARSSAPEDKAGPQAAYLAQGIEAGRPRRGAAARFTRAWSELPTRNSRSFASITQMGFHMLHVTQAREAYPSAVSD